MFIKEDLIEDLCTDRAGQLMTAMHKIETWTKAMSLPLNHESLNGYD